MTWNFDARQHQPLADYETWPTGWAVVAIQSAEEKTTEGDEPGLEWHLKIKSLDTASPYKDNTHVIRVPYKTGKPKQEEYAHKLMTSLCYVTNVISFSHPGQLANIPFWVKVTQRTVKGENGAEDRVFNDFKDFKSATNGMSAVDIARGMQGQQQQPMQAAQPVQQFQPAAQPAAQPQPAFQPAAQPVAAQPAQAWPNPQPGAQPAAVAAQPAQAWVAPEVAAVQPAAQPMQPQPQPMAAQPAPQPGAAPWGPPPT